MKMSGIRKRIQKCKFKHSGLTELAFIFLNLNKCFDCRQTSDRDSLDENAVTSHAEAIRSAPQPNGGTFISSERQTVYSDSCNRYDRSLTSTFF